jgi:hypothetical protein
MIVRGVASGVNAEGGLEPVTAGGDRGAAAPLMRRSRAMPPKDRPAEAAAGPRAPYRWHFAVTSKGRDRVKSV